MTYSLPFGLTQKPVNKYFEHGVIKFSCREGRLYYTVKRITKTRNVSLLTSRVKTLDQLNHLLSVKHLHEIPLIEVVN